MLTAAAVARMPRLHTNYVDETENLAAGAKDWTHFPGGAFRRQGHWFADLTAGGPERRGNSWRLTATPAVKSTRPAKTGGDHHRHDQEHTTNLGEFGSFAAAVKAGERWLTAQNKTILQGAWVGRADW